MQHDEQIFFKLFFMIVLWMILYMMRYIAMICSTAVL